MGLEVPNAKNATSLLGRILPAPSYNFPMRKALLVIGGLLLLFLGAYSLPDRGIPYTSTKTANLGLFEASARIPKKIELHPLVSWLLVAAGAGLAAAGAYGKK